MSWLQIFQSFEHDFVAIFLLQQGGIHTWIEFSRSSLAPSLVRSLKNKKKCVWVYYIEFDSSLTSYVFFYLIWTQIKYIKMSFGVSKKCPLMVQWDILNDLKTKKSPRKLKKSFFQKNFFASYQASKILQNKSVWQNPSKILDLVLHILSLWRFWYF